MADLNVSELITAAHVLARHRLVTAFGHASQRLDDTRFVMTPPRPLGSLTPADALVEVSLREEKLPPAAPGEAWIHWAMYRQRPDLHSVCRAQPEIVHVVAAAALPIRPIHGQGAWVAAGEVPVFDDARLIRSRAAGEALARTLGNGNAVLLRGNGAVTAGTSVGEAVTLMWLLEVSARFNWQAASAGTPVALNAEELALWEQVRPELLPRLWAYLQAGQVH